MERNRVKIVPWSDTRPFVCSDGNLATKQVVFLQRPVRCQVAGQHRKQVNAGTRLFQTQTKLRLGPGLNPRSRAEPSPVSVILL